MINHLQLDLHHPQARQVRDFLEKLAPAQESRLDQQIDTVAEQYQELLNQALLPLSTAIFQQILHLAQEDSAGETRQPSASSN